MIKFSIYVCIVGCGQNGYGLCKWEKQQFALKNTTRSWIRQRECGGGCWAGNWARGNPGPPHMDTHTRTHIYTVLGTSNQIYECVRVCACVCVCVPRKE